MTFLSKDKCKLKGCTDAQLREELKRREEWTLADIEIDFYVRNVKLGVQIERDDFPVKIDKVWLEDVLSSSHMFNVKFK